MPHIVLEYSHKLEQSVDFKSVLETLHQALGEVESFETDRIKSRAIPLDQFLVGREKDREFVHVALSFSSGRREILRIQLGRRLLDILMDDVCPPGIKVSRSVEVRQFEPEMYFNDYERQETNGDNRSLT